MSTVLEQLAKKSANELSAKELNAIRRYRAYCQKLQKLDSKEKKLAKQVEAAQKEHRSIQTKREGLAEKIATLETQYGETEKPKPEKTTIKKEAKKLNGAAKSADKESATESGRA